LCGVKRIGERKGGGKTDDLLLATQLVSDLANQPPARDLTQRSESISCFSLSDQLILGTGGQGSFEPPTQSRFQARALTLLLALGDPQGAQRRAIRRFLGRLCATRRLP